MATLYAGPWVGELGWELFGWQSFIRPIASRFDRVIVSTRPGHEVLYKDFCSEFVLVDPPQRDTSGHVLVGFDYDGAHTRYVNGKPDLWIGPMSFERGIQDFVRYGLPSEDLRFDILLHARWTEKVYSAHRNWPLERWSILVGQLRDRGLKVASLGSPRAAVHVGGTTDLRGIPLAHLVDIMASSRLMIGPSSGPMHLAALCRCPHVVWTDTSYQDVIKATNRERYERLWNPFRTPVRVVDQYGWQPPPEQVFATVMEFLETFPWNAGQ